MPPKSRAQRDPTEIAERRKFLPRLQHRAQNVLTLILGALPHKQEQEVILPQNITGWFHQIVSDKETNGFEDAQELFRSPFPLPPLHIL